MRCLTRNKTVFYYAAYEQQTEVIDEYGNTTGQYSVTYSKPIKVMGNVSAAQGEMQTRQFGESESYDKVIVLDDIKTPIDEYSVLWVDILPLLKEDGTTDTPHNYVVKKVAKSLNNVTIAISKVSVR